MTLQELRRARGHEWDVMNPAAKKWIVDTWSKELRRPQSAELGPEYLVFGTTKWLQGIVRDGRLPKDALAWARLTIRIRLIEDLTK